MSKLNINTQELQVLLNEVSSEINKIKEDNFFDKIKSINLLIARIKDKKSNIRNSLPKTDYRIVCDAVHRHVKQISGEFDSIIESKKEQQMLISSELSEIVNKKKLINYQR